MKNAFITLILFMAFLMCHIAAIADDWHWARTFVSPGQSQSADIVMDHDGNIYQVGAFMDEIHFEDISITAQGVGDSWDGFIVKADPEGTPVWAVRIGSEKSDRVNGVATDSQGNVIVTGYSTAGSGSYDGSVPLTFESTDGMDEVLEPTTRAAFIAKYDPSGELLWVDITKSSEDEYSHATSRDIGVDSQDNIIITGHFWKEVELGESYHFYAEHYGDGFIAKFNPSGNVLWAIQMNMSYGGRNTHIAVDLEDNIFIGGVFEGENIHFPDTTYVVTPPPESKGVTKGRHQTEKEGDIPMGDYVSGQPGVSDYDNHPLGQLKAQDKSSDYVWADEDGFIAKYDSQGDYLWSHHIGGVQDEKIAGVITDQQGNLFVAVNFMYNIEIGDEVFEAEYGGVDIHYYDMAIAKFDTHGQFSWALVEGTNTPRIWAQDLAINSQGRLLVAGSFQHSPIFDEDVSISGNGQSTFLAKYNNDGSFIRVLPVYGEYTSRQTPSAGVFYDPDDNLYMGGVFTNNIIFGDQVYYGQGPNADVFMASGWLELPPPPIDHPGPQEITAQVYDQYNVALEWNDPPLFYNTPEQLSYDDEDVTGELDMEGTPIDIAVRFQHPEDAVLDKIQVYLQPKTHFEQPDLVLYVLGDNNGLPDPSDVIGGPYNAHIPGGSGFVDTWVSAQVDDLLIPGGEPFHVVSEWQSGAQYRVNQDANSPGMLSSAKIQGEWHSFVNMGMDDGLMFRAHMKLPAEVLYHNVYRNDEKINSVPLNGQDYNDLKLPNGTHTYHITSVFDAGETTASEEKAVEVSFVDHTDFAVNVTTNSGVSPEGALVTLSNKNGDFDFVYLKEVTAEGLALFEEVWTGWGEEKYNLSVRLYGHELYEAKGIKINEETESYQVALKEYIHQPYGLDVHPEEQAPGTALFSWNNTEDFFEDFEGDAFPPEGWIKINPDDGMGWQRIKAGQTPLGWGGGEVEPSPGGGQHMAYVTYETGGELVNDQWLVTPQITVANDAVLSFYLRYEPDMFDDRVEIRLSTTGQNKAEAFDIVVDSLKFGPGSSTEWNYYEYNLTNYVAPGTQVYIAFREHMEYDLATPIITLDNVFVGKSDLKCSGQKQLVDFKVFEGFNIFLNDMASPLVTGVSELEHFFVQLSQGEHVAGVQAQYSSGVSEIATVEFIIEEDFDTHVELLDASDVKLYPNPASDNVNVYCSHLMETIKVMDLYGNVVYHSQVDAKEHIVNVAYLESSTYLLRVETSKGYYSRIIQVVR